MHATNKAICSRINNKDGGNTVKHGCVLCVCACIHVCVHACMCVHVCVCIWLCVQVHVRACGCKCNARVCMRVHVHVCMSVHVDAHAVTDHLPLHPKVLLVLLTERLPVLDVEYEFAVYCIT